MAQEDKGLVWRGLILLGGIGVIVAAVLAIVLYRPQTPPPLAEAPPIEHIPAVALPHVGGFPSGISWFALQKLGETMPSTPGWDIRYNAAAALARRGSDKVPWDLIREMLDEKQQMRNNRVRLKDGRDVYDEASARATMIGALKAIAAWHDKRKDDARREVPSALRDLYPIVDKLAQSEFGELRLQAGRAKDTFFR